ncbi:hypothetical protein CES85_3803 (plasmid) [Ochrobactrum quorumnocens]|uniref:Uncharacterized protein n=1 Tax=Ochrobactrum quorumnocens TaxID=271865 RepID=A0A248UR09_9HYPH|nr:hypothetical protein CES85_3803 [[Ochrobactrum] quorumnocens]
MFAAFVKTEVAHGVPYRLFLLMTVGFVGISMGYSRFADWFALPGAESCSTQLLPSAALTIFSDFYVSPL